MNFPWFVAERLIKGRVNAKSFSRPINVIAIIGIALGLAVMILAISILTGFNSLNLRCILIGQIIRDLDALQGNTEKPSNPHSIPSHR